MMNTIPHYEKNHKKIFEAVKHPKWRIWKTIDEDGILRQNKEQITNPARLLRFIKRCKNPKSLYVSVSEFLNPHRNHGFFHQQRMDYEDRYIYPREGYLAADCILLDSYFFVDLDSETSMKDVEEDAQKIINKMDELVRYELKHIQFSGTKGVHLVYADSEKPSIGDPVERVKYYQTRNESIAELLVGLDLKTIDSNHINIMKDVFRVYAAPHSIKANGGIVRPLSRGDISRGVLAREALKRADDKQVASHEYGDVERAGLISRPTFFRFVDNMVHGLKDTYVTVVKVHKKRFKLEKLKELQDVHKLSHFYIFEAEKYIYAYNFKLVQYPKLVKILRRAKSSNLGFFMGRKHAPLPLSRIEYKGCMRSEHGLRDAHSRPHCNLLGITAFNNLAGADHNRVGTMKVMA